MIRHILLTGISALLLTAPVAAQNAVPNPLRPAPAERRTTETPRTETKPAEAANPAKPPRERSAKQRQSDDDMRACGASWRAEKDAQKAKGVTWRSYLKDCRAAKKVGRDKA